MSIQICTVRSGKCFICGQNLGKPKHIKWLEAWKSARTYYKDENT